MKVWLLASRPKTLFAAISPVIIGTVMAIGDGKAHWPAALAALLGAILIQIGTNFANDYADFFKGADTHERLGPTRVTQSKMVTPVTMRNATILVFGLAILVGSYLVWRGGLPVVAIGLLSIVAGLLYTAGPYPLAYIGAADLFVLVFFGPVAVGGTYYVQALAITPTVLIVGLAPGLFSMGILTVNNLRDVEQDRAANKRTPVVRLGRTFARWAYAIYIVGACLIPAILVAQGAAPVWSLLTAAVLIPAFPALRSVFVDQGRTLNKTLALTGQLLLLYSVLFGVGWLIG